MRIDPVFLCNDLGRDERPVSRAVRGSGSSSISIKEAVKIAQNNNFMGLVCCSKLLVNYTLFLSLFLCCGLICLLPPDTWHSVGHGACASGVHPRRRASARLRQFGGGGRGESAKQQECYGRSTAATTQRAGGRHFECKRRVTLRPRHAVKIETPSFPSLFIPSSILFYFIFFLGEGGTMVKVGLVFIECTYVWGFLGWDQDI